MGHKKEKSLTLPWLSEFFSGRYCIPPPLSSTRTSTRYSPGLTFLPSIETSHTAEVLLTDELEDGLGIIEGCEHPANWPGGSWLFCEAVGICAGPGADAGPGPSAAELRRLRSSFIVSWRINMFSNDSPGGQTSWSPLWKVWNITVKISLGFYVNNQQMSLLCSF